MNKALCSLPWNHLATHPHGGITLCCQSEMAQGLSVASNQDGRDPMTLNERSIDEMVNSKTFREVRLAMLRGERHPACGPCWDREDHRVSSKRLLENQRFPLSLDDAQRRTAADGTIAVDLRFAELRLGNTCNIKCVTCNPNSSILMNREYEVMRQRSGMEFLRDYSWVKPGMSNWTEDPKFWDELLERAPNLEEIYINGGEPMLIRRHGKFLEDLVARGQANKIRLSYSINLTKLLEPLVSIWQQFAGVHFACSVDDWDQRNFYIRYPTSWDAVTENFKKLQDWKFTPQVLQTVSALNFFYLDDFHCRWQQRFPGTVIALNEVVDPPWFSPLVLPPALRRKILLRLRKFLPMNSMQKLEGLYNNDEHRLDQWQNLKRHLRAYDELRALSVVEYFPELERELNELGESLR